MFLKSKELCQVFDNGHGEIVYELIGKATGGSDNYSVAFVELLPEIAPKFILIQLLKKAIIYLKARDD